MRISDFPILHQKISGKPLIYLDSAASAQKPKQVIEAIQNYYCHDHANVHRGVHTLSERATQAYENARHTVREFINASQDQEIIFTRGTTESINLVASCLGQWLMNEGDEILISAMEHHANIIPWQQICHQKKAKLKVIPLTKDGGIDLAEYQALISPRTRLVAITHFSHVLGVINPIKAMIELAHQSNIPVLIDAAQSIGHLPIDVQALGCDFLAFSGHKLYGPTGIGVLYGQSVWLQTMPPYQTGGGMISRVSFEKTEFAESPAKFEAGTPHIAGAVGLAAAMNYISEIGFSKIIEHEQLLTQYALKQLAQVPGLTVLPAKIMRGGVISFYMQQAHPHDIATILALDGIAVRAGHHCAMPLMDLLQISATVRISFGIYNRIEEIDRLIDSLQKVIKLFDCHCEPAGRSNPVQE